METFKNIEKKLHQFTRKYYTSELLKGVILFHSFGLVYLFFTLYLEYFLWFQPFVKTILFWLFLLIESFFLIRFIGIPIFKLMGLKKGITDVQSSKIIGAFFPEVQDKLLNVLQLKQANNNQSDLLIASIHQKSIELQPFLFRQAVNYKKNIKYLKYAVFPFLIWGLTLFIGVDGELKKSLKRFVNYRTTYVPPAPFSFYLDTISLKAVQGKSLPILIKVKGSVIPNDAKIHYESQQYYLQNNKNGTFSFTFFDVQKPLTFFIESSGVQSKKYTINLLHTPTINNISLDLVYPKYIRKQNEKLTSSGNITVPEGTQILWNVYANQTDSISFVEQDKRDYFKRVSENYFTYSKKIIREFNYKISTTNTYLKDYESLQFYVDVIKDEFPKITVQTNNSLNTLEPGQFAGHISDDYGIKQFQVVYYEENYPRSLKKIDLPLTTNTFQSFFYQFPDGLTLDEGKNYEFFFQVSDNDAVNGSKKAKSEIFNLRNKTSLELRQELFQEQRNTIHTIEKALINQQNNQINLERVQNDLQLKKKLNWNDKIKFQKLTDRQNTYHRMMQRQIERLIQNLDEKKSDSKVLQNKKELLKKRIEELKKTQKQQQLLDEIQKLATKLNKEDLLKKTKEFAQQNKQQERSLQRILELTKRFYIEQKTMQIAQKIDNLSKKQKELANKKEDSIIEQKEIKQKFNAIKEEFKELYEDNEKLKDPMNLPDVEDEKEDVDLELKKTEEMFSKKTSLEKKNHQNRAAKKMKEMSIKMQNKMMEMQGESIEENMDDLRKILDNLVIFSFKQEQLMNIFDVISTAHPDFGKDLKRQNQLKTYFEHIDDSLYVLSMRMPKISAKIKEDISTTFYNLDQSLENFAENRFPNGVSNQRYVMTAVNNLADYLSNILNSMKNSMSMKIGKGKKGKGSGFSLPDLIKKQGELSKKMSKGTNKRKGPGEGKKGTKGKKGDAQGNTQGKATKRGDNTRENGNSNGGKKDDLDGQLYEIYKQQSILRQELQNQLNKISNGNLNNNTEARKALKTMEELENEILEKGFNSATFQKMQHLNYQLLKLKKAGLKQGMDNKRQSRTNTSEYKKNAIKAINFNKQFYNQIEILNRQSLPLHQNYKKKVRAYFSDINKE